MLRECGRGMRVRYVSHTCPMEGRKGMEGFAVSTRSAERYDHGTARIDDGATLLA